MAAEHPAHPPPTITTLPAILFSPNGCFHRTAFIKQRNHSSHDTYATRCFIAARVSL
jgi:hypothetical protein